MTTLQKKYSESVNAYLKVFENKQGIKLEFWVHEDNFSLASFGDVLFISFYDIKHDIDNDIPANTIIDWIYHELGGKREEHISYNNYIKGIRHSSPLTKG